MPTQSAPTAPIERSTNQPGHTEHRLCPWWAGYLLASPLRRLVENPQAILAPHVRPGMTVCDLGCAMGFFSLPLARMVGPTGRVICVDVQERMLRTLRRRARRRQLQRTVEIRTCTRDDLGIGDLAGQVDLVVAYHVVHEAASPERFLRACFESLRPGGRLLLAEPRGHVKAAQFAHELGAAAVAGFEQIEHTGPRRSYAALLEKPAVPDQSAPRQ